MELGILIFPLRRANFRFIEPNQLCFFFCWFSFFISGRYPVIRTSTWEVLVIWSLMKRIGCWTWDLNPKSATSWRKCRKIDRLWCSALHGLKKCNSWRFLVECKDWLENPQIFFWSNQKCVGQSFTHYVARFWETEARFPQHAHPCPSWKCIQFVCERRYQPGGLDVELHRHDVRTFIRCWNWTHFSMLLLDLMFNVRYVQRERPWKNSLGRIANLC